jgi:hypothetical protein
MFFVLAIPGYRSFLIAQTTNNFLKLTTLLISGSSALRFSSGVFGYLAIFSKKT